MDSNKESDSVPDFTFPDDGGRPHIEKSSSPPKFRPNDQVELYDSKLNEWTGPYFVSQHELKYTLDNGQQEERRQYKLCNDQQEEVNDGNWVGENDLRLYDPFEDR
ncbi:hypothetical protein V8C40DRAFT_252169 [Trichoderma camerunense]